MPARILIVMRILLRLVTTFVAAVATYYFVYWFGGALIGSILRGPLPNGIAVVTSLLVAIFVTCYVWIQSGSSQTGLFGCVALGSLVTGTIGFSVGFFGPILFTPQANQGPMLGIFITGPLGFMLGGMGGAMYWRARRDRTGTRTDSPRSNRWRGRRGRGNASAALNRAFLGDPSTSPLHDTLRVRWFAGVIPCTSPLLLGTSMAPTTSL